MSVLNTTAPASYSIPINLAADTTLTSPPRGMHVGTPGNIVGQLEFDTADVTYAVNGGAYYPYRFKIIRSTANGTTATGLVGLN